MFHVNLPECNLCFCLGLFFLQTSKELDAYRLIVWVVLGMLESNIVY